MNKRWITFDLDGTLMQNPFGAWVFPEIADAVAGRLGRPHDIVADLVAEHEMRMEQGRFVEAYDWDDILAVSFARLGLEDPLEIEPLVRKHAVSPKIRLLESGIPEVLEGIKARGFSLAAVTNGFYKFQAPVMEALGLMKHFDDIVTPERAGTGKPDPAILQSLPGKVVAHVGDRLDHDVQVANRSKIVSVLIDRSLPAELVALVPGVRGKDERGIRHCCERWKKESKSRLHQDDELPKMLTPTFVIGSVQELVPVLDDFLVG